MDFLEIFHRSVSQKELPLRIDDNEGGVGGAGPIFSGTGNFNHFTHKPILALQVSNAKLSEGSL